MFLLAFCPTPELDFIQVFLFAPVIYIKSYYVTKVQIWRRRLVVARSAKACKTLFEQYFKTNTKKLSSRRHCIGRNLEGYPSQPSASLDNINLVVKNNRYHAKTKFNNCLLLNKIYLSRFCLMYRGMYTGYKP